MPTGIVVSMDVFGGGMRALAPARRSGLRTAEVRVELLNKYFAKPLIRIRRRRFYIITSCLMISQHHPDLKRNVTYPHLTLTYLCCDSLINRVLGNQLNIPKHICIFNPDEE